MALDTLRGNKLRSFLTIIGVVVGVITVMVISSFISGINLALENQIKSFGTQSIFVYKMDIGVRFGRPSREERMRPDLTLDDALAFRELPDVITSVPFLNVSSGFFGNRTTVSGKGKQTSNIQLSGTLPRSKRQERKLLWRADGLLRPRMDFRKDVCIIGATVKETFFPFESPIGQTLEINGRPFTMIGHLEKKDQTPGRRRGKQRRAATRSIFRSMPHKGSSRTPTISSFLLWRSEGQHNQLHVIRWRIFCVFAATSNMGRRTISRPPPPIASLSNFNR
jgi:putative ABC transport system permease protein